MKNLQIHWVQVSFEFILLLDWHLRVLVVKYKISFFLFFLKKHILCPTPTHTLLLGRECDSVVESETARVHMWASTLSGLEQLLGDADLCLLGCSGCTAHLVIVKIQWADVPTAVSIISAQGKCGLWVNADLVMKCPTDDCSVWLQVTVHYHLGKVFTAQES